MYVRNITIIFNLKVDDFKAKVVSYLYGVVASILRADIVNGDVAGDGVSSIGVPAVDVYLVTGHCLRRVVSRSEEVEEEVVWQRESLKVQRQLHGTTQVVDGGRGWFSRSRHPRSTW